MALNKIIKTTLESLAYSPTTKTYNPSDIGINSFLATTAGNIHRLEINPVCQEKLTILHFHGSGYNISQHLTHIKWLPEQGIKTVMFDYPGYGKSTGIPSRSSVLAAAVELLNSEIDNATSPLFVLGQSLGGAIALEAYSYMKKPNQISGVVIDSTFSRYSEMAALKLARKGGVYPWIKWLPLHMMGNEHDPIEHVDSVHSPLLLIHSQDDTVVPISLAQELIKKLQEKATTKILHGVDHTEAFRGNHKDMRMTLLNWMEAKK